MATLIPGTRLYQSSRTFADHDEIFSPSQVEKAEGCLTEWSLRYLWRLRGMPTRGRVFGKLLHSAAEAHFDPRLSVYDPQYKSEDLQELFVWSGGNEARATEMLEEAPRRFEPGIQYLPNPHECDRLWVERPLTSFPTLSDEADLLLWRGIEDVLSVKDRSWLLNDHKSTAGGMRPSPALGKRRIYDPWLYVPTAAELKQSLQALIYGYDVMAGMLTHLDCRWVYYCSNFSRKPDACYVDFRLEFNEVCSQLEPHLRFAHGLRDWVRMAKRNGGPPPQLVTGYPATGIDDPESICAKYRGCDYHIDCGGVCLVDGTLTDRIANQAFKGR